MKQFDVQFGVDDVLRRFDSIREQGKRKKTLLITLRHNLLGAMGGAANSLDYVLVEKTDAQSMPKVQFAYIHNIYSTIQCTLHGLSDIFREVNGNDAIPENWYRTESSIERFKDLLERLSYFLPITEDALALGNLSEPNIDMLRRADMHSAIGFYRFNREFATSLKSDKYYLSADFNFLYSLLLEQRKINMMFGKEDVEVEMKVDYFSNAILPLVENIFDHAYTENQKKNMGIKSTSDEEKEVTIEVIDFGIGISQVIQKHLFEHGASTKTDKTSEHGIGLWAVKQFVEENGGRILCESELGKGTTFKFTIPYTEKVGGIYRQ